MIKLGTSFWLFTKWSRRSRKNCLSRRSHITHKSRSRKTKDLLHKRGRTKLVRVLSKTLYQWTCARVVPKATSWNIHFPQTWNERSIQSVCGKLKKNETTEVNSPHPSFKKQFLKKIAIPVCTSIYGSQIYVACSYDTWSDEDEIGEQIFENFNMSKTQFRKISSRFFDDRMLDMVGNVDATLKLGCSEIATRLFRFRGIEDALCSKKTLIALKLLSENKLFHE